MTGTITDTTPTTKAKLRNLRTSAFKAREVLDLIRHKSYSEASEILEFSERAVSRDIAKVLDSAVANAEHNDYQVAEELYVSACYADEGPTLKRWRPRARGRATSILKRTCHVTVVVSRYDSATLERAQNAPARRAAATGGTEARRRRVLQSLRSRTASRRAEDPDDEVAEPTVSEQAAEIVALTAASIEAADSRDPGDDQDLPDGADLDNSDGLNDSVEAAEEDKL